MVILVVVKIVVVLSNDPLAMQHVLQLILVREDVIVLSLVLLLKQVVETIMLHHMEKHFKLLLLLPGNHIRIVLIAMYTLVVMLLKYNLDILLLLWVHQF